MDQILFTWISIIVIFGLEITNPNTPAKITPHFSQNML